MREASEVSTTKIRISVGSTHILVLPSAVVTVRRVLWFPSYTCSHTVRRTIKNRSSRRTVHRRGWDMMSLLQEGEGWLQVQVVEPGGDTVFRETRTRDAATWTRCTAPRGATISKPSRCCGSKSIFQCEYHYSDVFRVKLIGLYCL